MPIGITTYLSRLQPNVPVMTGNRLYKDSKRHGTAVDRLVQKAVRGEKLGRLGGLAAHKAKGLFFAELHEARVVITDVQVPVKTARVRTQLDGLGHTYDQTKVVIELKTSLHPLAFYKRHYQTTVPKQDPHILPGIPNTMYWRHQLQAGFGVACLGGDTKGLVVVVCSDGAMHHWVQAAATRKEHFEHEVVSDTPGVRMLKWPGHDSVKHLVRGLGRQRKGVKYGVAHYTRAVVGVVSKPGKRADKQKELIRREAVKRGVQGYVIHNNEDKLKILAV